MSMRSFNKLKTKLHFLGVASINREISKEKKNGKDKNVIKSESRRITFRDDNYAIDSKSRFAEIVDEIPLDGKVMYVCAILQNNVMDCYKTKIRLDKQKIKESSVHIEDNVEFADIGTKKKGNDVSSLLGDI